MRKLLVLMAGLVLSMGVQAQNLPYKMPQQTYRDLRVAEPLKSPFNVYPGMLPATQPIIKENWLVQFGPVPAFGNRMFHYNTNGDGWVVYKNYQVRDATYTTKSKTTGLYRYYDHTIDEYHLQKGNRSRKWGLDGTTNANVIMLSDTGWVPGRPGDTFNQTDWDSSNEISTVDTGDWLFKDTRNIWVEWRLTRAFPPTAATDIEYLLKWEGYAWGLGKFFERTFNPAPTHYVRMLYGTYPLGALYINVENPRMPNTKVFGYPLVIQAFDGPWENTDQ